MSEFDDGQSNPHTVGRRRVGNPRLRRLLFFVQAQETRMSVLNRFQLIGVAVLVLWSLTAHAVDVTTQPGTDERLRSARQAIEAKDWSSARFHLRAAERSDGRNADVHNLLGYLYRKQPQPDLPKALEHYQTALRLDPAHRGAHEYIGEAYLMLGQPEKAQEHLARLEAICGNRNCEEYVDLARSIQERAKR